jgi:hypothetical protein
MGVVDDVVVEDVVLVVVVGTQVVPWQVPDPPNGVVQSVPGATTEVTQPPSMQLTVRQTGGVGHSLISEQLQ